MWANTVGQGAMEVLGIIRSKHIKIIEKNAIYYNKTQHANFRGKPLFQAAKQLLHNS